MTSAEWLRYATLTLVQAGIGTASLDALILLEDTLGVDRAYILATPERQITPKQFARLAILVQRRTTHEPLAYIRQKTEFYGREFYVDHRVLEPRPESEMMIDLLKTLPLPHNATIIDVGTGSGALAITARLEIPSARVIGVDIDPGCLEVASHNNDTYGAAVSFRMSDLLAAFSAKELDCTTLLCNLPYVPDDFQINNAATHEPKLAIFGGQDGLDLYRKLFQQISFCDKQPLHILTESLPTSHASLTKIAGDASYVLTNTDDFMQIFRKANASLAL